MAGANIKSAIVGMMLSRPVAVTPKEGALAFLTSGDGESDIRQARLLDGTASPAYAVGS